MREIVVQFKNDIQNKKHEEYRLPVKYGYDTGKKVIQIMNRKLSNLYKNDYLSVTYVYDNQNQVIFINYLK